MKKATLFGWLGVVSSLTLFGGARPVEANICALPPEMFPPEWGIENLNTDHLIIPYLYNHAFDVPNFAPDDRVVYGRFSAPEGFHAQLDEALKEYMVKRWGSPRDESVSDFGHWIFPDAVTFEDYVFDPKTGWQEETLVLDVPYSCGEEGYCNLGVNLARPSINMIHKYGEPEGPETATALGICESINGIDIATQVRIDELHQCLLAKRCPI